MIMRTTLILGLLVGIVMVLGAARGAGPRSAAAQQPAAMPRIIESGPTGDGYQWSIGRATEGGPRRFQALERTPEGMVWRTEPAHPEVLEPTEAGRYREFLPYLFGADGLRVVVPASPLSRPGTRPGAVVDPLPTPAGR
ncbi:MAG: hypothetical protein HYY96_16365 [Candidatus Tectomicrobia bacterium]|nr:hypothetical protein [Candidatus Tectomicrobia bacterium]